MLPIGLQIYQKRLERGMTQAELAQKAGIPQPNLSNIEKGKQDITISTLRRIAYGLQAEMVDFFRSESKTKGRQYLSLTRPTRDRITRALATGRKSGLSSKERKIVELFQEIIPEVKKHPSRIRAMNYSWLKLRTLVDLPVINDIAKHTRAMLKYTA